jgi:hypothetical protein
MKLINVNVVENVNKYCYIRKVLLCYIIKKKLIVKKLFLVQKKKKSNLLIGNIY